jgi:hypothetical protein
MIVLFSLTDSKKGTARWLTMLACASFPVLCTGLHTGASYPVSPGGWL